jgi:hypothetical protein
MVTAEVPLLAIGRATLFFKRLGHLTKVLSVRVLPVVNCEPPEPAFERRDLPPSAR